MTRILLRARRVVDGAGSVIEHGAVLVSDGIIEAIGPSDRLGQPADVEVVDLSSDTVLPGLIDVHHHVTFPGDPTLVQQVMSHDTDAMLAQGRTAAAELVAAGVTTVRDLGAMGDALFRLAAEIAAGTTPGPHIVPSTVQLTSLRGPNSPLGGGMADLAACRERIDADAAQGARVVKIIATGSITDTGSDPTQPVFDDATVAGIVEHAQRAGMRVAAHAHGSAGVAQAARCGVDTIEHASFLTRITTSDAPDHASATAFSEVLTTWPDADTLAALTTHRPWIIPTITSTHAHAQFDRVNPQSLRDLAHRTALGRTLLEHGLSLATGTDGGSPGVPHLGLVVEIEQFHQLGMSTNEALTAATGHAADALGLTDRGVLRQGLRADIVAVSGNPLRHLDSLRAPSMVMQGGAVVHRVEQRPTL